MGCVKSNLNPSDLLTVLSWLTQFEIINIKHVEPVVRRKGRPCHLKTQALMSCEGLMTNDSWTEVLSSLFVLIWSRVSLWEIPRAAWSDLWYVSMVESTYCVSWLNGVPVLFVKSVILYDCVCLTISVLICQHVWLIILLKALKTLELPDRGNHVLLRNTMVSRINEAVTCHINLWMISPKRDPKHQWSTPVFYGGYLVQVHFLVWSLLFVSEHARSLRD